MGILFYIFMFGCSLRRLADYGFTETIRTQKNSTYLEMITQNTALRPNTTCLFATLGFLEYICSRMIC